MKSVMNLATILLLFFLPGLLFTSDNPTQTSAGAEARVPGTIDLGTESKDVISSPNKVKAGEEFEVKISTVGGGCEREGDVSVILGENTASLFVYDFTTATQPDVACTMIMKRLPHSVKLTFKKSGDVIIRVWGRRIGQDTPPDGEPMILEKKITVE